ncbi:MAG: CFI-box-CTERM domain-containing protein [Candidatus Brocadiia bacterium]
MKVLFRTFLLVAIAITMVFAGARAAIAEHKFGPDALNYYQGTDAIEDQWIDLLSAGGAINGLNSLLSPSAGLDDNCTQLIDIGFNFNFYGNITTKLYINLNGVLILQPPTGAPTPATSDLTRNFAPLGANGTPNGDGTAYVLWSDILPNSIIAPFCANLTFTTGSGSLLYQTVGSGTNKIFIAQWKNVPLMNHPEQTVTFQIQLHANGFIYFVYQTVPDSLADPLDGSRWTGVENEQGTVGLTYTTTQSANPNNRVPYTLTTGLNILIYSNQDTVKLSVVSAYGNPSPPVGDQVPRPKDSLVTAVVEPTVETTPGIRYRCTGWVGTGSCPASWDGTGSPNFVVFKIEQDSSITWQWIQEFRIQVDSLGNNGNPQPPIGDNWYPAFNTVQLSVTSPYQSWNCSGFTGTGDIGAGTQTSFSITVTQPSTIIWNWAYSGNLLSLGVISPFGTPNPAGLTLWSPGAVITATVPATVDVGGTIYNCTGYAGTGSVPTVGVGNSVTFTILANSNITWNWQKQGGGTLLLTINSQFPPIPGYKRLFDRETVYVSAQSPVEGSGYRWVCSGFTSNGSPIQAPSTASSFSFLMTTATTINFLWQRYFRLDVVSGTGTELLGNPQLSVGGGSNLPVQAESWWFTTMPFSLSVTSPFIPDGTSGVRYTCLGWSGIGNIPQTDHSTTSVVFFMDTPTEITWNWQKEYQFTVLNPRNLPGPNPSVGSYWYPAGATVSGSSINKSGPYACMGYNGTGSVADSTAITFSFIIAEPSSVEWVWELTLPAFAAPQIVDTTSGFYTALARESGTGYPWIAFFDSDNGDLVVVHFDGTNWIRQSVATIGNTGQFPSIALDNLNYPHVSYYDASNGDLRYAHWTGVNWELILVDGDGDVGQYSTIALLSTPNGIVPAIAYYDATNRVLKYAERSGSGFATQTVTAAGNDCGKFASLAFDGFRNIPSIAYYDATNGDVMFASRLGGIWTSEVVFGDGDVGRFSALAFNADNEPGVCYYDLTNRDLKYSQKHNGTWMAPVTVDSDGDVGQFCSLKFTANNIPMISYADYGRETLKFAFFTGVDWTTMNLDSNGNNVGWYTSLALDSYGNPGISYATSTSVKYIQVDPAVDTGDGGTTPLAQGGGAACFIASSAFGTMAASTVEALCSSRDASIMSADSGSALISLYYAVSPSLANAVRMSESARATVRAFLGELVK